MFEDQVRDALGHLHDLTYLQTHPLGDFARNGGHPMAVERGRVLQRALEDAIGLLAVAQEGRIADRRRRTHLVLALRYVQGLSNSEVQATLGIGRSEFQRTHRRALDAVSAILRDRWLESSPSDRPIEFGELETNQIQPSRTSPTTDRRRLIGARPLSPSTSFVGRGREVGQVRRLLTGRARSPLVTLTGIGGGGKTRLAMEVAGQVPDAFPDGVWLVDLSGLTDPRFVAGAVGLALGIPKELNESIGTSLLGHLKSMRALLILDNCDYVLNAIADLTRAVLVNCPRVQLLATSRERIGILGEVVVQVPPLVVPPRGMGKTREEIRKYPAVRLFVDRARAAQSTFSLSDENAGTIAEICRQLDGLPLAIELAVSRIRALTIEQIADRLGDRFRLLTHGDRRAPTRSQTMRASLDSSYELLSPREQLVFRRLAVFVNGWTLDGAEAVCGDELIESAEIDPLLARLVDKSLVVRENTTGDRRYRMLETVRQYAAEIMPDIQEQSRIRHCHLQWCTARAERIGREFRGPNDVAGLNKLEVDLGNFDAALSWSLEADPQTGLRLANAIGVFWFRKGHRTEGCRWLQALLERSRTPGEETLSLEAARVRARALFLVRHALPINKFLDGMRCVRWMSWLEPAMRQRPPLNLAEELSRRAPIAQAERVAKQLGESLELSRSLGDQPAVGEVLRALSFLELMSGQVERARDYLRASLEVARSLGDPSSIAWVRLLLAGVDRFDDGPPRSDQHLAEIHAQFQANGDFRGMACANLFLGEVALRDGQLAEAGARITEGLARFQQMGDKRSTGVARICLGIVERVRGHHERAGQLFSDSLPFHLDNGYHDHLGVTYSNLGSLARKSNDLESARASFVSCLTNFRQSHNRIGVALGLCLLGLLEVETGEPARGVRLLYAANSQFGAVRSLLDRGEQADYDLVMATSERSSDSGVWQRLRAEGEGLTPEMAVAYAVT